MNPREEQSRGTVMSWCSSAIVQLCFQHRAWPRGHSKPFKAVLPCVHLEHAKQTNTQYPGIAQKSALTAWWAAAQLCPSMQSSCKHKLQLEEHLLRHRMFVIYCRQILQYLQGTTQLKEQATDTSEEHTGSSNKQL